VVGDGFDRLAKRLVSRRSVLKGAVAAGAALVVKDFALPLSSAAAEVAPNTPDSCFAEASAACLTNETIDIAACIAVTAIPAALSACLAGAFCNAIQCSDKLFEVCEVCPSGSRDCVSNGTQDRHLQALRTTLGKLPGANVASCIPTKAFFGRRCCTGNEQCNQTFGCVSCGPCEASTGLFGWCQSTCASDEACCNGQCTNTSGDNANCGACGHACSGSETCIDGVCQCRAGTFRCGTDCCGNNLGCCDTGQGIPVCMALSSGNICGPGRALCPQDAGSPFWWSPICGPAPPPPLA
jgi:hypothetical protein